MTSTATIRIVLVDDHAAIRAGLAAVFASRPEIQIVAAYESSADMLANLARDQADVILLDLRLPGMDGMETLAALRAMGALARVLILSSQEGDEAIYRAMKAGAAGYVLKTESNSHLVQAVRDAAHGKAALSAEVATRLAQRLNAAELSAREIEILRLISDGKSNREIAKELGISPNTVNNHVAHLIEKLGANDRTHAVTLALQKGIIQLSGG